MHLPVQVSIVKFSCISGNNGSNLKTTQTMSFFSVDNS